MARRPIYISIMDAAERGRGVMLTAAEVHELSFDSAIATRAMVECEDDCDALDEKFTWRWALADWHRRNPT